MHAWTLQHVSLWLEDGAPNEAFAHALEWAYRLNVPLRVVAIAHPRVISRIKAWGETSALRGVVLDTHLTVEKTHGDVERYRRPNGLCVFCPASQPNLDKEFEQQASPVPNVCQLRCAKLFAPMSRLLILCSDTERSSQFLDNAVRLCQALEITPVVLVLARSEHDAKLKQEYAESQFHSRRMQADIDFVIDGDPCQAVNRVVSWRRCSHVIVPPSAKATNWEHRDLPKSVSVLTMPDEGPLDLPCRIRSGRGILSRNQLEEIDAVPRTEYV